MKFGGNDLTGKRFRRLVVKERIASLDRDMKWLCICDCGEQTVTTSAALRSGRTGSCGCYMKQRTRETSITHGKYGTQEHGIWRDILARCRNPNVKNFSSYGGRGIQICKEWEKNFLAFLAYVGPRPSKNHSIDRIDTNGNYEPGNVRWATRLEQATNKRWTRFVEYKGERMALTNAVRAAGSVIHHEAAWIRIKTGWPVETALETPRLFESGNSKSRRARHAHLCRQVLR